MPFNYFRVQSGGVTNSSITVEWSYLNTNSYAIDVQIRRTATNGGTVIETLYDSDSIPINWAQNQTATGSVTASGLCPGITYYFEAYIKRNSNNDFVEETQLIQATTGSPIPPPSFSGTFANASKDVDYYSTISISGAASGNIPTLYQPQDNGYLPPGLSLSGNNTSAIISGTPTQTGTYGFDLSIFTPCGGLRIDSFTITVSNPLPSWGFSTYGDGRISSFYDQTVSADFATSYSIVSGSLPAGLSLTTSSGRISGTPTTRGTSTFTIRATNSAGSQDKSFSIRIYAKLPSWTAAGADTTLNSDLRVGTPYSDAISAVDATSYGIRPGTSLPSGLSLNTSTGAITGTPTGNGTFNFTIRAFNLDSEFVERSFSLFVKRRVPVWTDQTVSLIAVQNEAYSNGVTATDAASYSLKSGSLPPGISLNTSNGVISGTPTTPGAYSFVITASNADTSPNTASIDTATLSISVGLPGGRPYVFNGTSWVQREIYVNNGAWNTQAEIYYYDGSSWQQALP